MDSTFHQTERRKFDRKSVKLRAMISAGDWHVEGEVLNLSKRGARVHLPNPWDNDNATEIEIEIEKFGSCGGLLVWTEGNVVGISFTGELSLLACFLSGAYQPFK